MLQIILILFCIAFNLLNAASPPYGQLSVSGTQLVGSSGSAVELHGMSLFWSIYSEGSPYWNYTAIQAIKCQWNSNVVRAAMGVEGGYLTDASGQLAMVETVIEAAISLGIYVIVDWHVSATYQSQAITFFQTISSKYGSYPNILYEIYNEPLSVSWTGVLVPYHKAVIAAIRANDAKNVIICGTPNWSQDVDVVSANPITGYSNIMYTLHFYAATHGQTYRDKGLPVFVTEYGTTEASGDGTVDSSATATWWTFLDGLKISYVNWAIDEKSESSAALVSGTPVSGVGTSSYWTTSGKLVNAHYQTESNGVSCSSSSATTTTTKSGATTTTTKSGATTTTTTAKSTTTTKASSDTASVSISITTVNTWSGGGQFTVAIKNTGTKSVCSVTFKITMPSGETISSIWNASGSSGQYTASSLNLAAGATNSNVGFTVSGGSTAPTASVVSTTAC